MQLFADRVVVRAIADQLLQLRFELGILFTQRQDLTLGDRNRMTRVWMRDENFGK